MLKAIILSKSVAKWRRYTEYLALPVTLVRCPIEHPNFCWWHHQQKAVGGICKLDQVVTIV